MNVEICNDAKRWDAFVASHSEASNYQRWGWRVAIESTFAHESYYLAATDNGEVKGVLPLVHMKSHLFGNFFVSMPFFSYGGVLASAPEAREALLAKAADLARGVGGSHIELRQGRPQPAAWRGATPQSAT